MGLTFKALKIASRSLTGKNTIQREEAGCGAVAQSVARPLKVPAGAQQRSQSGATLLEVGSNPGTAALGGRKKS